MNSFFNEEYEMRKRFINSEFKAVLANIIETIQRLFTKTSHKFLCHFEFVSEFHEVKIPHQVRDDIKGQIFQPFKPLTIRKAFAFTLAETLIVMGIIGVVAALTIPNLNSSTADKEKVAKLNKVYSNLQDAFGRAEAVYGPYDEWFQTDTTMDTQTTRFAERVGEFLKVSKNCGHNVNGTCMTTGQYKNIAGTHYVTTPVSADNVSAILADGTSILFSKYTSDSTGIIFVDIDGPTKGLFKYGVDLFEFRVDSTNGLHYIKDYDNGITSCVGEGAGVYGCEMWVIQNGNMDYLKADKTGKCPNGKVLNYTTNTSCK